MHPDKTDYKNSSPSKKDHPLLNPTKAGGLKLLIRALHHRNYRLFFSGQFISLIGTWMQKIALYWLIYRLTNSPRILGITEFASQIPVFFLTPFAGVLSDRLNRRRLLIATQMLSMAQASMLAILVLTGSVVVWHLIALSLLLGIINAFDLPIRQAFVVDLVERREDLGNALALNSFLVNGTRLLGPSLAGILIALTGEGICFLLNAVSYLAVIAALLAMTIPAKINTTPVSELPVVKDIIRGFRYSYRSIPIRSMLLLLGVTSIMAMPYQILMPVFAKSILQGNSQTLGFLMGATGIGAITGAFYLGSRKNALGLEKMIVIASSLLGFSLILFSVSRMFLFSAFFLAFIGLGIMVQAVSCNTLLQTIVEDDMRGRVMSLYTMAFIGLTPFGSLLAGELASRIGAPTTLTIGGICCLCGAVFIRSRSHEISKALHSAYIRMNILAEPTK